MACTNGRANPATVTKLRLFADSGGYCAKPDCLSPIFVDLESNTVHVGEIAHVISAMDGGPRSDSALNGSERSNYENLILLCPYCHTVIDKAEKDFPAELLLQWKANHKQTISDAFGVNAHETRELARNAVEPLIEENKFIFDEYGPLTDERFNPESDMPAQWLRKIHGTIIPNNRRIIGLCDKNANHLTDVERRLLQAFRQHVDDFEAKHLVGAEQNGRRFPDGFDRIFT